MNKQTLWLIGGGIVLYYLFSQQAAPGGTVAGLGASPRPILPPRPIPRLAAPKSPLAAPPGQQFGISHRSRYG